MCIIHFVMNIILFAQLNEKNSLPINDERARHIKKILKLKIGENFSAGIINGDKGVATIIDINSETLDFSFEITISEVDKLHPLTLLIAFVRPICMKRILREAVSLGVETIVIAGADTTEKSYAKANFYIKDEYKRVLIDGAMQAAQTSISEVKIVDNMADAIRLFDNSFDKILLDNVLKGESLSLYQRVNEKCVVAIGPERGFSKRERNMFKSSGFNSYTLGKRVLRSETAACASIALTLSRMNLI
jgi:RsmE family RNA methyltransferase